MKPKTHRPGHRAGWPRLADGGVARANAQRARHSACRASRRSSSKSSASGSTTSSRWKRPRKAWGRRSTARAARSATTSRPSAEPERWPSCGRDAGTRAASSRRSTPRATRCFTCSPSRATAVSRCCRRTRTCSRGGCRFRCSAPASSRPSPTTRCAASRIPNDRNGDGVSGRAAVDRRRRNRRTPRRTVRLEGAARDADHVRRRRLSQRDGDHQRPVPARKRVRHPADRMRLCDPFSDPEDIRDPRTRRRGIDNFASFMRFLAPAGRGDVNDQVRAGEQVFAAIGCATLPRSEPRDRTERQSALPPEDRGAVFGPSAP